jgi:hypothetical protein
LGDSFLPLAGLAVLSAVLVGKPNLSARFFNVSSSTG